MSGKTAAGPVTDGAQNGAQMLIGRLRESQLQDLQVWHAVLQKLRQSTHLHVHIGVKDDPKTELP